MRWFLCDGFSYELLVFGGFLIQIVSFKVIFIIKKGYVYAWGGRVKMCEFCTYIVAFKIIFSMKRGYVYVWGGRVKMCEFCVYAFLKSKSIQAKNVQKVHQNGLFTSTNLK